MRPREQANAGRRKRRPMATPRTPAPSPTQALAQHASMLGHVVYLLASVVRDQTEESAALAQAATRLQALSQAIPAPRETLAAVRDATLLAERALARLAQPAPENEGPNEGSRLARSSYERLMAQ